MIRQQIEKAGGKTYSKQKFHCDKDSSLTYQRLKVNPRTDSDGKTILPTPPEMLTRSCVEIPIQLLLDRLNGFEPPDAPNMEALVRVTSWILLGKPASPTTPKA